MSPRLLFIADLHLSAHHPRITQGFLQLLAHYQQQPTDLYILGDWFNAWLDDADQSTWLTPIVTALQAFTQAGNHIYFLVGNRDFVLGQAFLNRFGGQLITEPYLLEWQGLQLRLEHGDGLCIDDVAYQRYKRVIRHPWVLGFLKRLPFGFKQRIADFFRKQSKQRQQQANYLTVDVNAQYVSLQMQTIDLLIHGHTHKPEIEPLPHGKYRIVLGDWRETSGSAEILELTTPNHIALTSWLF